MGQQRASLRAPGRVLAGLLVACSAVLVVTPTSAQAAPGPVVQPGATTATADALPTAQVNGVVFSQAIAGDTVFVGGEFTATREAGVAPSGPSVKRSNLMAYDVVSGKATSFAPTVNGRIKAVRLSPDKKTLYIGGLFSSVNGRSRHGVAAFDVATGVLTAFAPRTNGPVEALVVTPTTLYLGGSFSSVNFLPRSRLAAVSRQNAGALGWAPKADAMVHALAISPDQTRIVAGGSFATLAGTAAVGMGAVDAVTGVSRPWAANTVIKNSGDVAGIYSLTTGGDAIYGTAYAFGGGNYEGAFAADPYTGKIRWLQDCHGDTYDVAPVGDTVYSVGHAHFCQNIGGFPDTSPRTGYYRTLAVTRSATGTVATNSQAGAHYGNFAGQPAPSLYNWFPDLTAGTYTGLTQAAWSVTGDSRYVVLGGEFPQVNGTAQEGLVRFAVPSSGKAPYRQGPQDSSTASTPTTTARTDGGGVTVAFRANWDRDDQRLSYDVLRNGVAVHTLTATSQFWNRPTLTWTDSTGTAGVSYEYRIRVKDPHGNALTSAPSTVSYPQR